MTETQLPERGIVFWPVGTGDSTTVVVDERHVLQVDIRHMEMANGDGAVVSAVVDRLAETLPTDPATERPYLAVFALTHADQDHCDGFEELLDSDVLIGEIWATPRLWREFAADQEMCQDAKRFHEESKRRVDATLKAVAAGQSPASGDRVRIIGYDIDRDDHPYSELPDEYFTFPGETISTLDGEDVSGQFEAFVHAPFKEDAAAERNATSLAMQLTLKDGDTGGRVLLLGDLAHETIIKIFDYSALHHPDRVAWDVLLAAHHGSKRAMYSTGDEGEEDRQEDVLTAFETNAGDGAYIVISSRPFEEKDDVGGGPPHHLAREAYEELVDVDHVLCTGEYPTVESPLPLVFALNNGALELVAVEQLAEAEDLELAASGAGRMLAKLARSRLPQTGESTTEAPSGAELVREGVKRARGDDAAPATAVGFGLS